MKTKIYIRLLFFVSIFFFCSCYQNLEIIPPTIEVTPDSMIEISVVKPAKYIVKIHANEVLRKLEIRSKPSFFDKDTLFGEFAHREEINYSFSLTEISLALLKDSFIDITFTAKDDYNSASVTRRVKVVYGYPEILESEIKLFSPMSGDCFYSFSDDSLQSVITYTYLLPELVYYIDDVYKSCICSPDAQWLSDKMAAYNYIPSQMKRTKLQKVYANWTEVNSKYLHEVFLNNQYINSIEDNGIGIINLKNTEIIIFQLENKIKGAIKIKEIDAINKYIIINIKIQNQADF